MASIELEPTNTGILKMKDCLSLRDLINNLCKICQEQCYEYILFKASSTKVKALTFGRPRLEILSHSASLISFEESRRKSKTCCVYLSTIIKFVEKLFAKIHIIGRILSHLMLKNTRLICGNYSAPPMVWEVTWPSYAARGCWVVTHAWGSSASLPSS